jgi:metal-dependent hydrolase (beta-lactamase superfamily II)
MPGELSWTGLVVALITTFGGLAGVAGLVNSITAAKKAEVGILVATVDSIAAENKRLREIVEEVRNELEEVKRADLRLIVRNAELEKKYFWSRGEIQRLRDAVLKAGIQIAQEAEAENRRDET